METHTSGVYIPGVAESLGYRALRIEQALERRVRARDSRVFSGPSSRSPPSLRVGIERSGRPPTGRRARGSELSESFGLTNLPHSATPKRG